jgi:hypothetical protein
MHWNTLLMLALLLWSACRWSDWMKDGLDDPDVQDEREDALSAEAFLAYTQLQADNSQKDDDEDDMDDEVIAGAAAASGLQE